MEFLLNHAHSFWFGLAAFLIFVGLIAKFGVGPILRAVDARDAKIASQMEESAKAFARAKELQAELDKQLKGAEARIAEMIAEGKRDAEAAKAKIVAEGRQEVDAIRVRAQREIEAARYEAVVALKKEVAEIATNVAEKILDSQLDANRHQELVGAAIDAFESRAGQGV